MSLFKEAVNPFKVEKRVIGVFRGNGPSVKYKDSKLFSQLSGNKKPVSSVASAIIDTPRNVSTQAERPVTMTLGGKQTNLEFNRIRSLIGRLFAGAGLHSEWISAVKANEVGDLKVLKEKLQSYDPEFKRLYLAVQDTFSNAGRPEMATEFSKVVTPYTAKVHPVDFIATLLKGASSPVASAATENQYKALRPFKSLMQTALINKGQAAPEDMDSLTQLFYNTFVTKATQAPVLNFDEMKPGEQYYADEAIVNAVVTYVKTLADQKANGAVLSKSEDRIATTGLQIQNQLAQTATDEVNKEVGETITSNSKTILIVGGLVVLVALYFMFKK